MKALLLKYNSRTGGDKLPKIQELAKKHDLKIESVEDLQESPTKLLKVVRVSGETANLHKLDKELVRHASITRKALS